MNKIICVFLSAFLLLSITGCSSKNNNPVSEIIENYEQYHEALKENGVISKIESADKKTGSYLNEDGYVLTIYDKDGKEYVFFIQTEEWVLRGEVCQIYWQAEKLLNDTVVVCDISLLMEFDDKQNTFRIGYKYKSKEMDDDGNSRSGVGVATYDYGIFTLDPENQPWKRLKKIREPNGGFLLRNFPIITTNRGSITTLYAK
ncbi:MAG: hypothetical protein LBL82_03525 [Oscillospiraceae bacterium]|jgi:uncharacterized protein YcfL|nr:hypothetical protein [Oscillospiraceae bacterium]